MAVGCMCIACWVLKAKSMYSEYVILIAFPLQQRLHERASVLCYTYVARVVTCDLEKRQFYFRHTAFPVTTELQKARQTLV
jgi:hypothetical protein